MKKRVIYYSDELNDDFANTNISAKELGSDFEYNHKNPIWNIFSFILYYFIAIPISIIINKLFNHQKFINKKVLKKCKDQGYIIYSNHTHHLNDCFSNPPLVFPRKNYIIASKDAFSIFGIKNIVQMLGAIPLPTTIKEHRNFSQFIEKKLKEKQIITIYPEAHIWPYYTKIRPFISSSFKYPIKYNVPIFCITHCYKKRRFSNKAKIESYIDGPFFPNANLDLKEASDDLRNQVYQTMCDRSEKHSTYQYVQYIKKD